MLITFLVFFLNMSFSYLIKKLWQQQQQQKVVASEGRTKS